MKDRAASLPRPDPLREASPQLPYLGFKLALDPANLTRAHHHFKVVTAMSPLQYQKQIRLHEARTLMLSRGMDAASAGHEVGYDSPSQFSREYRRLFGAPPVQDAQRLRTQPDLAMGA
ncbi:helix-turn-helix domain-containing protein [Sphingomonas cavernae]|uniref:helix-turn-helix domain-containing protein n=1 Tax=Sphingomonas cavernae TaxID=2320861 RepID=UPI003B75B3A8